MSSGDVTVMTGADVKMLLAAGVHLGAKNCTDKMLQYVYRRKPDGIHLIHLGKTWEKMLLAARVIAGIENPADVCAIAARPQGTRAVLKFAHATGATPIAGRFTPGTFTNQIQKAFREPRLLVICDPTHDHQAIQEAPYVNIPVIALCDTDNILRYIDIAIPCNNKGTQAIGLMWWLLSREVLRIRGTISRAVPWEEMPDLYFYREPEEIKKEEMAEQEQRIEAQQAAAVMTEAPEVVPASEPTSQWMAEGTEVPHGAQEDLDAGAVSNWADDGANW